MIGLCKIYQYRFRPKLIPTLVTLALLPLLISLGQWQANKAERKQQLQQTFDERERAEPVLIGKQPLAPESRYRKVMAYGRYEFEYQILLDNQIHDGKAGYQVVTPLHLEGSEMRVLVYRGWIPLGADRNRPPAAEPPSGMVTVTGVADQPSGRYIELEESGKPASMIQRDWQAVWQNLDMDRYRKVVPFPLQTLAIRLDAEARGGYARDWTRPAERIDVHRGYAFQWYALAVLLVLYYAFTQIEKIKGRSTDASK